MVRPKKSRSVRKPTEGPTPSADETNFLHANLRNSLENLSMSANDPTTTSMTTSIDQTKFLKSSNRISVKDFSLSSSNIPIQNRENFVNFDKTSSTVATNSTNFLGGRGTGRVAFQEINPSFVSGLNTTNYSSASAATKSNLSMAIDKTIFMQKKTRKNLKNDVTDSSNLSNTGKNTKNRVSLGQTVFMNEEKGRKSVGVHRVVENESLADDNDAPELANRNQPNQTNFMQSQQRLVDYSETSMTQSEATTHKAEKTTEGTEPTERTDTNQAEKTNFLYNFGRKILSKTGLISPNTSTTAQPVDSQKTKFIESKNRIDLSDVISDDETNTNMQLSVTENQVQITHDHDEPSHFGNFSAVSLTRATEIGLPQGETQEFTSDTQTFVTTTDVTEMVVEQTSRSVKVESEDDEEEEETTIASHGTGITHDSKISSQPGDDEQPNENDQDDQDDSRSIQTMSDADSIQDASEPEYLITGDNQNINGGILQQSTKQQLTDQNNDNYTTYSGPSIVDTNKTVSRVNFNPYNDVRHIQSVSQMNGRPLMPQYEESILKESSDGTQAFGYTRYEPPSEIEQSSSKSHMSVNFNTDQTQTKSHTTGNYYSDLDLTYQNRLDKEKENRLINQMAEFGSVSHNSYNHSINPDFLATQNFDDKSLGGVSKFDGMNSDMISQFDIEEMGGQVYGGNVPAGNNVQGPPDQNPWGQNHGQNPPGPEPQHIGQAPAPNDYSSNSDPYSDDSDDDYDPINKRHENPHKRAKRDAESFKKVENFSDDEREMKAILMQRELSRKQKTRPKKKVTKSKNVENPLAAKDAAEGDINPGALPSDKQKKKINTGKVTGRIQRFVPKTYEELLPKLMGTENQIFTAIKRRRELLKLSEDPENDPESKVHLPDLSDEKLFSIVEKCNEKLAKVIPRYIRKVRPEDEHRLGNRSKHRLVIIITNLLSKNNIRGGVCKNKISDKKW